MLYGVSAEIPQVKSREDAMNMNQTLAHPRNRTADCLMGMSPDPNRVTVVLDLRETPVRKLKELRLQVPMDEPDGETWALRALGYILSRELGQLAEVFCISAGTKYEIHLVVKPGVEVTDVWEAAKSCVQKNTPLSVA